jgi:hypothetical protein
MAGLIDILLYFCHSYLTLTIITQMKKFIILSLLLSAMAFNFTSCELLEDEDEIITNQIENQTITTNVTWEAGTYTIEGTLYINNGGSLTIEPGAIIKLNQDARIQVGNDGYGTLIANGTESSPIPIYFFIHYKTKRSMGTY